MPFVSLTIEGIKVYNPKQFFTGAAGAQSPLFDIQLPTDNIYGMDDTLVPQLKLSPSAEQGYYYYLLPCCRASTSCAGSPRAAHQVLCKTSPTT